MQSSAINPSSQNDIPQKNAARIKTFTWIALGLIVILAAVLRFANINSLGYVNHYYAAAVKSMLQSWHNFFFVAAEPGASVTVDKPPLGLWLQAGSAYFLGVNTLGLLMPQILAGLASILVVFHLVRRKFGEAAGLLAALALAITPVVVATDRNNTIDSTLIFTLLLAAWAFIKATETSRLRYLFLGAVLVGLAFNIKMLAAYLPLPAFFGMYLLGAHKPFWHKIGQLTLAGLVLLAVSFSWAVAVDLTPEEQRPYVGSSSDNSEITLILGYNGVSRLLGMARTRILTAHPGARQPIPPRPNLPPKTTGTVPPNPQAGVQPGQPPDGNPTPNTRAAGGFNIGQAGADRLFTPPLSKEASWLLLMGLAGMLILLFGARLTLPLHEKHQALVLWGGWLLTAAVFFSVATFFHEYYLSLLGAPLAALVGIGVMDIWNLRKSHPLPASFAIIGLCLLTLLFQVYTALSFIPSLWWLGLMAAFFVAGSTLLLISKKENMFAPIGFALVLLSVFITPAVWSVYTNQYAGANLSLPAAYEGESQVPPNRGDIHVNRRLLNFLEAHTDGFKYLMAVPSSMQGADYVLATGRPVLYMGGFNGNDNVVSVEDLTQMVQDGELRYIYWGEQNNQAKAEITRWVVSQCSVVKGFEIVSSNFGAPDGTNVNPANVGVQRNNLPITLYDCAQ